MKSFFNKLLENSIYMIKKILRKFKVIYKKQYYIELKDIRVI